MNPIDPRNAPDTRRQASWAGRWLRALAAIALAGAVASCGSGDDGPLLRRFVVFGDSVSDMGTHQVGAVAALGGGKYTVDPAPVWTELVARRLDYPMTVGVNGGFGFAPVECPQPPNCTNWSMGGSRVTLRPGVREYPDGSGQLAFTIKEQIDLHLTRFGGFDNNDLVAVQAGGNDLFVQLDSIQAMLGSGMTIEQAVAAVVTAMATAGAELAVHVKNDIIARGAQQVVVWNLFDISDSPWGRRLDAQTRGLITVMTDAFNAQLVAGLAGSSAKLFDSKQMLAQWLADPAAYGFSNATTEACSKDKIAALTGGLILDGAALFCSTLTLIDEDTSRFMFADDVHPAPYSHQLVADHFFSELRRHGWR